LNQDFGALDVQIDHLEHCHNLLALTVLIIQNSFAFDAL
jgi:hypothetical protein